MPEVKDVLKSGKAKIFVVKDKKDLEVVTDREYSHKFILTNRGELIVTVRNDLTFFPHGGIAHYSKAMFGTSEKVVSAGYLLRGRDRILVNNVSGHYHPPRDRVALAKYRIRGMGVPAKNGEDIRS